MTNERFNKIVEEQMNTCRKVLCKKSDEYDRPVIEGTENDRLHTFTVAAALQGASRRGALAGMMVKHTTCLYDMCKDKAQHDIELWEEKITDHINYLLLLKAVVLEEGEKDEI